MHAEKKTNLCSQQRKQQFFTGGVYNNTTTSTIQQTQSPLNPQSTTTLLINFHLDLLNCSICENTFGVTLLKVGANQTLDRKWVEHTAYLCD